MSNQNQRNGDTVKQSKPTSKASDDYEIPIGDTYKLNARRKLGSGAFGDIYLGVNVKNNEEVAIKLESTKSRHPQLFYEGKLYMALQGGSKFSSYIYTHSWYTELALVWQSRQLQYSHNGFVGVEFGGVVQLLQTQVHFENDIDAF